MPSSTIPKRKLGNTGLEVTVLGMGGAPLGGLFQVRGAAFSPFGDQWCICGFSLLVWLSVVSMKLIFVCLSCMPGGGSHALAKGVFLKQGHAFGPSCYPSDSPFRI